MCVCVAIECESNTLRRMIRGKRQERDEFLVDARGSRQSSVIPPRAYFTRRCVMLNFYYVCGDLFRALALVWPSKPKARESE